MANELRLRDYHTIENLKVTLKDDIDFQLFMQFKSLSTMVQSENTLMIVV